MMETCANSDVAESGCADACLAKAENIVHQMRLCTTERELWRYVASGDDQLSELAELLGHVRTKHVWKQWPEKFSQTP